MQTDNELHAFHSKRIPAEQYWLAVILVIAAVLRFYHYSAFSFSNDELSAINRLRFDTFAQLVNGGFYVDGHPGGVQVFLWYWAKLAGNSEADLRLPFVIMGVLAVLLSYLVAKRLFGKVCGLFTAAALAFLEFPLLYSQIARPYGSGLFLCLLMVFFWLRVVFDNNERVRLSRRHVLNLSLYTLATVLCMYNHYFSFLFALIVGVSGFFFLRKRFIFVYIVSGFIAVLLFMPHLGITLNHLSYKGVGLWLGKPGLGWFPEHISFVLNSSLSLILVFTLTSFLLTWQGKQFRIHKGVAWLISGWFVLPIIIGYAYSLLINPVLQDSVLIFSFPFLIMLLFMAGGNEFGKFQQFLLAFLLLSGVFSTVIENRYYSKQHFGEFKGVAEATRIWEATYHADSMAKVVVANSPYYLDYYFEKLRYTTQFDMYDIRDEKDISAFSSLVRETKQPYFLYAWTKPAPNGLEDIIRSRFPYIVKSIHFGSLSGISLFGRTGDIQLEPGMELRSIFSDTLDFDTLYQDIKSKGRKKGLFFSPPNALELDSLTEFSACFNKALDVFKENEAVLVVTKARFFPFSDSTQALLVVTVETKEGKPIRWESTLLDRVAVKERWNQVINTLYLSAKDCRESRLKIYIWNKGKRKLLLDDIEYTVYSIGNHSPFSREQTIWGDKM